MRKTVVLALGMILAAPAVRAADVEANYTKHCVSCHAKDGSGDTRMGKKAGTKDYRDAKVVAEIKDDEAFTRVKEGQTENGKEKMKPFKDKLSDEEIKALIAHLKAFAKK